MSANKVAKISQRKAELANFLDNLQVDVKLIYSVQERMWYVQPYGEEEVAVRSILDIVEVINQTNK